MGKYLRALILLLVFPSMVRARPLKAMPIGGHFVVLAWTASPDPGATYNIWRQPGACTGLPGFAVFTKINLLLQSGLTYTDNSVLPGKYCYYVTANLGGAESVPSNTAEAVILPAAPSAVVTTGTQ